MKSKFKNILVTGGSGCIGIELINTLKKLKYNPIILDLPEQVERKKKFLNTNKIFLGSILDVSLLNYAMKNVDCVIHLAAHLGVQRTEKYPSRCLDINIQGSKNVIDSALISGVKRVIIASSSEVYGEPLNNNKLSEKSITQGKTVYAISKLAAEEYLKARCLEFSNFSGIILRYFNTFGPHQVSKFAIPKFISCVKSDKNITLNGDGSQLRSYCYVSDTVEGTIKTIDYKIKNKSRYEIFNIGNSNNVITISNLAKKIMNIGKKNLEIKKNKKFKNSDRKSSREIHSRVGNISKAKKELGFHPKISLSKGIKKIFDTDSLEDNWPKSS